MYLTSCSALSSDNLPVLIDTACRSFFQLQPSHTVFKRTDWAKFHTHLKDQIQFEPELHKGMVFDTYIENLSGAVLKSGNIYYQMSPA